MSILWIPVSDRVRCNYNRTIARKVPNAKIMADVNFQNRVTLETRGKDGYYVWGLTDGPMNKGKYEAVNPGDFIVFSESRGKGLYSLIRVGEMALRKPTIC